MGDHETLLRLRGKAAARGEPMFMGIPDAWYEKPRWRCENQHVSGMFIKSEERGDVCPACLEAVMLTFPGDRDGPLSAACAEDQKAAFAARLAGHECDHTAMAECCPGCGHFACPCGVAWDEGAEGGPYNEMTEDAFSASGGTT